MDGPFRFGLSLPGASSAPGRRRLRQLALVGVGAVIAVTVYSSVRSTTAVFTDPTAVGSNAIGAKHIFPGQRVTSAFDVHDASGGGPAVDRSSPFAFAGDGRTVTTSAWSVSFVASRYLQFDMSAPLPGGLTVSGGSFAFRVASVAPGGTVCVFFELRRVSDDGLVATYGSAGSPAGCVTGTTLTTITQGLGVSTTDAANDLRIRVRGSDSGGNASVIDEARFTAATPYVAFSTYPVRYTDAADSTPTTTPWDLQGP